MTRFFLYLLCILSFMCCETQAKIATPKQVRSISFEWDENSVELSLYTEPQKKPHLRITRRQFYRATVRTADGKRLELQEEAPPISPSRETDVQMIRFDNIRAEFTEGREEPHVQLGKDTQVHLYSSRANEPIIVRARGLRISLHTELSDGEEYICATITPRKGKPRTVRRLLWKTEYNLPTQIGSIEPGVMQPQNKLYLTLQVGPVRCILEEDGSLIMCQPPVEHSEIDN